MSTSELLKKVRKIEIKTKGLSNHIFSGEYHTAFKGKGMAFSEVRGYQPGDDVRSIDWNVTARYNNPFVKVFEEEREMTVILLIDISGSSDFGTQTQLKREVATEIAAVLSFSAINNNDKIGVIFFSDKIEKYRMRRWAKPGITGFAAIQGFRGGTESMDLMQKRINLDVRYIEKWSFWLDLKICYQTTLETIFLKSKGH